MYCIQIYVNWKHIQWNWAWRKLIEKYTRLSLVNKIEYLLLHVYILIDILTWKGTKQNTDNNRKTIYLIDDWGAYVYVCILQLINFVLHVQFIMYLYRTAYAYNIYVNYSTSNIRYFDNYSKSFQNLLKTIYIDKSDEYTCKSNQPICYLKWELHHLSQIEKKKTISETRHIVYKFVNTDLQCV